MMGGCGSRPAPVRPTLDWPGRGVGMHAGCYLSSVVYVNVNANAHVRLHAKCVST